MLSWDKLGVVFELRWFENIAIINIAANLHKRRISQPAFKYSDIFFDAAGPSPYQPRYLMQH